MKAGVLGLIGYPFARRPPRLLRMDRTDSSEVLSIHVDLLGPPEMGQRSRLSDPASRSVVFAPFSQDPGISSA